MYLFIDNLEKLKAATHVVDEEGVNFILKNGLKISREGDNFFGRMRVPCFNGRENYSLTIVANSYDEVEHGFCELQALLREKKQRLLNEA